MYVGDGIFKKSQVAAKYGIHANTLSTVIKNQEQIETACDINQFETERKQMRNAKNEEIEVTLLKWIRKARNQNIILAGAVLQEKAKFFAEALGVMFKWMAVKV